MWKHIRSKNNSTISNVFTFKPLRLTTFLAIAKSKNEIEFKKKRETIYMTF